MQVFERGVLFSCWCLQNTRNAAGWSTCNNQVDLTGRVFFQERLLNRLDKPADIPELQQDLPGCKQGEKKCFGLVRFTVSHEQVEIDKEGLPVCSSVPVRGKSVWGHHFSRRCYVCVRDSNLTVANKSLQVGHPAR